MIIDNIVIDDDDETKAFSSDRSSLRDDAQLYDRTIFLLWGPTLTSTSTSMFI